MKIGICSFVLLFASSATAVVSAQTTTIDFNNDKVGEAPSGFSTALTGRGRPGKWVVIRDDASPDQGNVLAQTDADTTSYRFPVCVYDGRGTVQKIDLATNQVVKTIPITADAGTHGITFGQGGKLLFVTNTGAGTVSIIDTERDEVIKSVKVGPAPEGIAFKRP